MSGGTAPRRVMLLYWGRRGALSRYLLETGRAAMRNPAIEPVICVSRQNENFSAFAEFGEKLLPIDTFSRGHGAISNLWRIPSIRRQLLQRIKRDRIEAVITLMPHVWSPLASSAIRAAGARYATIIHDAVRHPGDLTGLVQGWHGRDMREADKVVALSDAVAQVLIASGQAKPPRLIKLSLPDLSYGARMIPAAPLPGEPWRLLFLGRIMPYKGLSLFVDAVERLKAAGIPVHAGVFGEGAMGAEAARLARMGAEVANRWLGEDEIADALTRYHALVLSHVEASQSGVAATAMAAGLPVVATPVGGLVEQVSDGVTGMLASAVDAPSLADAIMRLIESPDAYLRICANVAAGQESRSVDRFTDDLVRAVLD